MIWHCIMPYTDADGDAALYHCAASPETPARSLYQQFFAWLDAEDLVRPEARCAEYAARASEIWAAHHLIILCPDDPASYHLFPSHFVDDHYRTRTGPISPTLANIVAQAQGGL